jgi:hypothetical protein
MWILFEKQYLRIQEFPQYARIRIRSTGPSLTCHEAESALCDGRSGSVVDPGGGIVDDAR